jgi:hypothetical protein
MLAQSPGRTHGRGRGKIDSPGIRRRPAAASL